MFEDTSLMLFVAINIIIAWSTCWLERLCSKCPHREEERKVVWVCVCVCVFVKNRNRKECYVCQSERGCAWITYHALAQYSVRYATRIIVQTVLFLPPRICTSFPFLYPRF